MGTLAAVPTGSAVDPCCCGSGACCLPDCSCSVMTESACTEAGGIYQGDDTECSPNPCSQDRLFTSITVSMEILDGNVICHPDGNTMVISGSSPSRTYTFSETPSTGFQFNMPCPQGSATAYVDGSAFQGNFYSELGQVDVVCDPDCTPIVEEFCEKPEDPTMYAHLIEPGVEYDTFTEEFTINIRVEGVGGNVSCGEECGPPSDTTGSITIPKASIIGSHDIDLENDESGESYRVTVVFA